MNFNPEKCYVIHISKKPSAFDYILHNHVLEADSKYLGLSYV